MMKQSVKINNTLLIGDINFTWDLTDTNFQIFVNNNVIEMKIKKLLAKHSSIMSNLNSIGTESINIGTRKTKKIENQTKLDSIPIEKEIKKLSRNDIDLLDKLKKAFGYSKSRRKNILNINKISNQTLFSEVIIKNIYDDLVVLEKDKNILKKDLYRINNKIVVGYNDLNPTPGSGFKCLDYKIIANNIQKIINFANYEINPHENNLIKKSLLIMTLFVYVHPYPDFNGRVSRLIMERYLNWHHLGEYGSLILLIIAINKDKVFRDLDKLRKKVYQNQTAINLDSHINLIYRWFINVFSYLYKHSKKWENIKFNINSLSIFLLMILKTTTSSYKEFVIKDFEKLLKLKISKQGYINILNNLIKEKLVKKQTSKNQKSIYKLNNL